MKIRSISLRHFRRFEDTKLDFVDPVTQRAKDLIVLVGPNGAGKSTILQAIAASLGAATGRFKGPAGLKWTGFELELASRNWNSPPEVIVEVEFGDDEILHAWEMKQRLENETGREPAGPNPQKILSLHMDGNRVEVSPQGLDWQFMGRLYARKLVRVVGTQMYNRVGSVFWYKDTRNLRSFFTTANERRSGSAVDLLRERLGQWQLFHERVVRDELAIQPDQRDLWAQFTTAYQHIFPDRSLVGAIPRTSIGDIWDDPLFMLSDGANQYELSELSGGERAVFPILFDFVNWQINRSVVLIDEFELHLHPPMQQALLRALKKLGQENQFILTSHSDAVANVIPTDSMVRIKGG